MSSENTLNESTSINETNNFALRTFFNIMDSWEVPYSEQVCLLGFKSIDHLNKLNHQAIDFLTPDTLIRISYILGIYKGLGKLLPTRQQSNKWVHRPNDAFNGLSAIEYMSEGTVTRLKKVREYIDAQTSI